MDFKFTNEIILKDNVRIGLYTYGIPSIYHWGERSCLTIGNFCSIANDVSIFLGGNHRIDWISTFPFSEFPNHFPLASKIEGYPSTKGDVIIGNDVWIGFGAVVMSGVKIGDGAVIAARTVVTKDVLPYEIVGGVPSRHIKFRFSDKVIIELMKIKWWNWEIDQIKEYSSIISSSNVDELKKCASRIKNRFEH